MTARSHTRQRNAWKRRQRIKLLKRAGAANLTEFFAMRDMTKDKDRKAARDELRIRKG